MKYSILMADDAEDDRFYMRLGLRDNPSLQIVAEVDNGEDVLSYLSGIGKYGDRQKFPFPDLLLLDLKMPCFNGFEILQWLRDHSFPELSVAVVSGSLLKSDADESLALGAHAYYTKASSRAELQQLARDLEQLMSS